MFKKMSTPVKAVLCTVFAASVVGACVTTAVLSDRNDITHSIDSMTDRAKEFYDSGEKEKAYYQLQIYCQERNNDADAWIMLGDWYMKDGTTEEAVKCYKKAAAISKTKTNAVDQLRRTITLSTLTDSPSFTVTPKVRYSMDMKVTFSTGNLAPEKSVSGQISNSGVVVDNANYKTTDWFKIDSRQKYLSMGGGCNCAIWEFADDNKEPIKIIKDEGYIHRLGTTSTTENRSFVTQEIPAESEYARVTYIDNTQTNTTPTDDSLVIFYGKLYSGFANSKPVTIKLPDLKQGQSIKYENGEWNLIENDTKTKLNLGKVYINNGTSVTVSGTLIGQIVFDTPKKAVSSSKSREYGIRYKLNDGNPICERLGDAKGMNFDYTVGDEWVNGTENDFDKAFPWCDMKLCNVADVGNGVKRITYQDSKSFKTDGSNGNVMVEIPKFFTKREIKDGYEYIWISGERHDGYSLEPAFTGRMGGTLANIYVGAYLTSDENDTFKSISGSRPLTNVSAKILTEKSGKAGFNYGEIDYLTYNAIQKLFMVETATLDSTSLISGLCNSYYYSPNDAQKLAASIKDDKNTNSITLQKSYITDNRFDVGDTVAILVNWDNYDVRYVEQREILKKTEDEAENTCTFIFSGTRVAEIMKGKTAITHIPRENGKTDSLKYCTAMEDNGEGKGSFKYRGIENLYGNVSVMLDRAFINNDSLFVKFPSNKIVSTSITPPTNEMMTTDYSLIDRLYCIKSLGYDKDNPLLLLPEAVADGATASNYFGDSWVFGDTSRKELYMTVGGSFGTGKLSGLFSTKSMAFEARSVSVGGRLIYR